MVERWLPIAGEEGRYEVSDLGRIRSLPREVRFGKGDATRIKPGKVLKQTWNAGYLKVSVGGRNGLLVHIIVLETFVGPRPGDPREIHGCHRNGDRSNCSLENLRWDTVVGNAADTVALGRSIKGTSAKASVLTEDAVREIKALLAEGSLPKSAIARRYGVSARTISHIVSKKSWYWVE